MVYLHICSRCHYETSKMSSILDHLKRNNPCACKYSDETREDLIETMLSRTFDCPYCKRNFAAARNLSKHAACCTKKELSELSQQIGSLVDTIQHLKENSSSSSSNNSSSIVNVNINNTFIVINNFGAEDRSYITQDIMQQCIDKMKIIPLIESVYFNPEHPENQTIKLKSEKQKRVILRQDDKWIEGDMTASIDSIMHRENTSLSSFFYDKIWPDKSINFDNKAWTHERLLRINDKNKSFFEQRREIQAKLKNELLQQSSVGRL